MTTGEQQAAAERVRRFRGWRRGTEVEYPYTDRPMFGYPAGYVSDLTTLADAYLVGEGEDPDSPADADFLRTLIEIGEPDFAGEWDRLNVSVVVKADGESVRVAATRGPISDWTRGRLRHLVAALSDEPKEGTANE